ncbi:serine carboxypeptidase [Mycena olivaceomarginata]|nr:serine carboxypeptidase [Mycena olivaceomarginata]
MHVLRRVRLAIQTILQVTLVAAAFQQPLLHSSESVGYRNGWDQYDEGLFTPLGNLDLLSENQFTVLRHPVFPSHGVRIKKSSFCDDTVQAYTGYIDIQARHIFFYFFESRNDPDTDDVIFWTNGGPGCSISANGTTTTMHPESWNSNSNIFFVDQPIGGTTEEAAKDMAAFVFIFFEHFSKFKGRAFHMAGESYGRFTIKNTKLAEAGLTPINLTSVMIGTERHHGFYHQVSSVFDMQCTSASVPPVVDIATCVQMKQVIPRCQQWLKKSCLDTFDRINCRAAMDFCEGNLEGPFWSTGKNPETLCYPVTRSIGSYLDRPEVRALLGVDPSLTANFSSCSGEVGRAFSDNLDGDQSTQHYVAALLERGVRVLIYVGTYDWICNWVGNERWTLAMEWSGQSEFSQQELKPWGVNEGDSRIGLTRSAKGLTFATVEGAGHMVPYDKPKESLELVQRWLSGRGF